MGFNTTAVFFNDEVDQLRRFAENPQLAQNFCLDLYYAILRVGHPQTEAQDFGIGRTVSQLHADWQQIVMVGNNTGKMIACLQSEDLESVAKILAEKAGYHLTKNRKK